MSSTWNGSALRTRYAQKYGLTDATSLLRVQEWMNEIQSDICSSFKWSFLKFKLKKSIAIGEQEISLAPQVPTAPTLALLAGGSLTADSAVYVKVTFLIYDESTTEFSSIESMPSITSNTVTPTAGNLSLTLTAIDTYDGSTSVKPIIIYRRIYLKTGAGDYILAKTLTDNTTVTTTITIPSTSLIEPPEYSMVEFLLGEDPLIELSSIALGQEKLDDILKTDPGLSASGTPNCYARIAPDRILLYPSPSVAITLSYYVQRRPSRIFADTDRTIQIQPTLKTVLDAGITSKFFEYKDSDGQETKLSNYEALRDKAGASKARTGGQAMTIKRVC